MAAHNRKSYANAMKLLKNLHFTSGALYQMKSKSNLKQ